MEIAGRGIRTLRLRPGLRAPPPRTPETRALAKDLELWLRGGRSGPWRATPDLTPFQRRVLTYVARIPRGETRTYGEVARALGTGARAVGQALKANPAPLLIPCHRVVASDGLGGFSGAGIGMKKRLLEMEMQPPRTLAFPPVKRG